MKRTYDPEKLTARRAVQAAVKRGDLVKPDTCSDCGEVHPSEMIDAHHHNGYALEHILDVEWLCKRCHGLKHGGALLITDDQRRTGVSTRLERYGPDERRETYLHSTDPEERRACGKRVMERLNAARTPEERSTLARKAAMTGTPEERRARAMLGVAARRAKQRDAQP
jgi:hypothetical protein